MKSILVFLTVLVLVTAPAGHAQAYIGPGAGFVFISSFLVIFLSVILAVFSLLLWPMRFLYRRVIRKQTKHSQANRVIVLGLDGLSPEVAEQMMGAGQLPHFSRLKEEGYFSSLKTTNPPISPVAWSSFQTGVNPGKHNIYDFLSRDPKTYLPVLSFSAIGKTRRTLQIGKFSIPLSKPGIRLLRKSTAFWKVLGDKGIFSTVVRVPVTFPPEKFHGVMLSAMGTPDLKGTQGTFTCYSTGNGNPEEHTGGVQITVKRIGNRIESYIPGPENPFLKDPDEIMLPFTLDLIPGKEAAIMRMNKTSIHLKTGEYSDWIDFAFRALPGVTIHGIGRFLVCRMEPEFAMYLTPINIDPEKPAMPISHPLLYAVYLSKLLGKYATLGEAEDTWALNEQVIDDVSFLTQAYLIFSERKNMLFQALKKTKQGVCVCVFDTPDRIQHMFWERPDEGHSGTEFNNLYPAPIRELYRTMDALLGEVMNILRKDDILFIVSDHGIKSFRRCFNLNTWLHQNGYLTLKEKVTEGGDFFANVNWETTRAYGVGLAGLYINQRGREQAGIVNPGEEKQQLKKELQDKLTRLLDEEEGKRPIAGVYDAEEIYSGPYRENGPDLVVGCNDGYRISWESVTGKLADKVFENNTKHWRADHCVDTSLVPGVLFCNRKLGAQNPEIIDLAPTILTLFGIDAPAYMDGKAMKVI